MGPVSALPERGEALGSANGEGREQPAPLPATRQAPAREHGDRRLAAALMAADAVALLLALAGLLLFAGPGATAVDVLVQLAAFPLWLGLCKALGLYERDRALIHKSTLDELPIVAHAVLLFVVLFYLAAPVLSAGYDIGRSEVLLFWLTLLASEPALRHGARTLARRSLPVERCVIVGAGSVARLVARKIEAQPEAHAYVVGYLDVDSDERRGIPGLPWLGELSELAEVCRAESISRVVVAFSSSSHDSLLDVVRTCKDQRLKITVVPRLFEVMGSSVTIDQVQGMTLLALPRFERTRAALAAKRALDVVGAAAGLVLLAPLLAAIAIAIRLDSRGPVLFGQRRIGRDGEPFLVWKFRTMVENAEELKAQLMHLNEAAAPMFKIENDPRITRVGRFLRRTSLDELPQLWNVLRGEMSLVGPRPLVPDEADHVIGRHRRRLDLTPGLTGPWQVHGRNRIPFHEMVEYDYLYVADWSLWNDLKLLVRTVRVVVHGQGM